MAYVLDNADARELQRLRHLEAFFDPGTKAHLTALGVGDGWRCLELGAGGGSIAAWLCERVGSKGLVVATDIDTRHLTQFQLPNLEVRRQDISVDELEEGVFDLAHVRFLLEHLSDPEQALRRIVSALRPGGHVLIEAPDWLSATSHPSSTAVDAVVRAILAVLAGAGYDAFCGRRIPDLLHAVGCTDVDAVGRWAVGPKLFDEFGNVGARLGFEQLAPLAVAQGLLDQCTLDEALVWLDAAGNKFLPFTAVAAWGRRA